MANNINMRDAGRNRREFNPTTDNRERWAKASGGAKLFVYGSFFFFFPFPIIWYVVKKNNFRRLQERINQSASGIDIQLQKRRDTLVKMYDAAKGYMKHEKDIQTMIAKVRSMKVSPQNRSEVNNELNRGLGRLIATFEAYPNLKANEAINKLMDESAYIEREIAAARRLYNADVTKINQDMVSVPSNVVAESLNLVSFPLFQASEEATKDVKLDFDN